MASFLDMGEKARRMNVARENIHDRIQVRHVRMMRCVAGVFFRGVVPVDLGAQAGVRVRVREQAVENAREHARGRVCARHDGQRAVCNHFCERWRRLRAVLAVLERRSIDADLAKKVAVETLPNNRIGPCGSCCPAVRAPAHAPYSTRASLSFSHRGRELNGYNPRAMEGGQTCPSS